MTDSELRDEVERLRHQVAGLTETVAALTMLVTGQRPSIFPYDEMNAYFNATPSDPYSLLQDLMGASHASAPGRGGDADHGLTPPPPQPRRRPPTQRPQHTDRLRPIRVRHLDPRAPARLPEVG